MRCDGYTYCLNAIQIDKWRWVSLTYELGVYYITLLEARQGEAGIGSVEGGDERR